MVVFLYFDIFFRYSQPVLKPKLHRDPDKKLGKCKNSGLGVYEMLQTDFNAYLRLHFGINRLNLFMLNSFNGLIHVTIWNNITLPLNTAGTVKFHYYDHPKLRYLLKTLCPKFKLFFSAFSTPSVPLIRDCLWDCPKVVFKTTFGSPKGGLIKEILLYFWKPHYRDWSHCTSTLIRAYTADACLLCVQHDKGSDLLLKNC